MGRKATSAFRVRINAEVRGRQRVPAPIPQTDIRRHLLRTRRQKVGHYQNKKSSRVPTGCSHKLVPAVVDDFPQIVPLLERELDVIDTYLGELLDHLLAQRE